MDINKLEYIKLSQELSIILKGLQSTKKNLTKVCNYSNSFIAVNGEGYFNDDINECLDKINSSIDNLNNNIIPYIKKLINSI